MLPHLPHLPDDICVLESAEQFGKGTPSPKTVGKLLNDFSEERRSSTRLRWIWRTVVLLLFLLVAAVGRGVVRERETVAPVSGLLNAKELVEVLKWPFCVGEAQKRVLAELEKKAGRTFGGSIWKVVEQADSLGIAGLDRAFLSAPAKRPSVEDAIKELQALRAGGTDKP